MFIYVYLGVALIRKCYIGSYLRIFGGPNVFAS
jgi:hypothetical protein